MSSLQASRTLVKSPPELWAELSDLGSLARHLGEFGDIRITKVDPESRVEWEADRASGTVRLEPSGWGTRVVLTVDTAGARRGTRAGGDAEPEAVPAPEPPPVAVVEADPVPKRSRCRSPKPAPEPDPHRSAAPQPKRGFWARLFGRKKLLPVEPDARAGRGGAVEPEPVDEEPEATEDTGLRHHRVGGPRARRRGARAGARARARRRPRGAQRRARHPRRRAPPALQPLLIPWRAVPSATERSILTAPGPVARTAAYAAAEPEQRWMLRAAARGPPLVRRGGLRPPRRRPSARRSGCCASPRRSASRSSARSSLLEDPPPLQSIWMLRQTDKVRESFVGRYWSREAGRDPASTTPRSPRRSTPTWRDFDNQAEWRFDVPLRADLRRGRRGRQPTTGSASSRAARRSTSEVEVDGGRAAPARRLPHPRRPGHRLGRRGSSSPTATRTRVDTERRRSRAARPSSKLFEPCSGGVSCARPRARYEAALRVSAWAARPGK